VVPAAITSEPIIQGIDAKDYYIGDIGN